MLLFDGFGAAQLDSTTLRGEQNEAAKNREELLLLLLHQWLLELA